jgi:hypothetical protein
MSDRAIGRKESSGLPNTEETTEKYKKSFLSAVKMQKSAHILLKFNFTLDFWGEFKIA